jgi:Zn-dependent oligopeptidase
VVTPRHAPFLLRLVNLRAEIARRLGYATWGDYQTETRMAKTAATAIKFEEDLVTALQTKFVAVEGMTERRQLAYGLLDLALNAPADVGRRLRVEVYGVGDTRDVSDSVKKFLGRPLSNKAFLQDIGIP